MRIQKIQLKNVGPFEDQTIEFQEVPNTDRKAEVHIFTGANGSGKTTLLTSLASIFERKANKIASRFHQSNSGGLIEIEFDSGSIFKIVQIEGGYNVKYPIEKDEKTLLDYKNTLEKKVIRKPLKFAFFAYSGNRNISDSKIKSIEEIKGSSLAQALNFNKENNTIIQWLANMIAKEAISKVQGKSTSARNFRSTIDSIEKVISKLITKDVFFNLKTTPFELVLVKNGEDLNFDILPDGLKSIISWLGDLLMRLDRTPWENNIPVFERNIILFLDEIEIHLHPDWQMKVLPIVQELFPNAQIFISTHSPFVVNSVDDAWVYKLDFDAKGNSVCKEIFKSETGKSFSYVLDEIFGVKEEFGQETEKLLDRFYTMRDALLEEKEIDEDSFRETIMELVKEGIEVQQIVGGELRQLQRITKKQFQL